MDSIPILYQI